MSNLFHSFDRGSLNVRITVPTPENIPVPAIAEAVDRLMTADDRLKRARQHVRASEAAVGVAVAADQRRVQEAIRAGAEPDDIPQPDELEQIAKDAEKKARAVIPTYEELYRDAYYNLAAQIDEHGLDWARESAIALDKAVNGLVAAQRKVQTLAADIAANYGVVTLATEGVRLGGFGIGQALTIEDGRVGVTLDEAVSGVQKAISQVAARIDVAKAAHERAVAQ